MTHDERTTHAVLTSLCEHMHATLAAHAAYESTGARRRACEAAADAIAASPATTLDAICTATDALAAADTADSVAWIDYCTMRSRLQNALRDLPGTLQRVLGPLTSIEPASLRAFLARTGAGVS